MANNATCWKAEYKRNSNWNFTRYCEQKGNAVYMYDKPDATRGPKMYELPLEVGNTWYVGRAEDTKWIDSAKVVALLDITLGDFTFDETYNISMPYWDEQQRRFRVPRIFILFHMLVW